MMLNQPGNLPRETSASVQQRGMTAVPHERPIAQKHKKRQEYKITLRSTNGHTDLGDGSFGANNSLSFLTNFPVRLDEDRSYRIALQSFSMVQTADAPKISMYGEVFTFSLDSMRFNNSFDTARGGMSSTLATWIGMNYQASIHSGAWINTPQWNTGMLSVSIRDVDGALSESISYDVSWVAELLIWADDNE